MPMFLVIAAAALRAPLIVHPVLTSRLAVARAPPGAGAPVLREHPRLYTQWHMLATGTGRLSSRHPNVQQVPKGTTTLRAESEGVTQVADEYAHTIGDVVDILRPLMARLDDLMASMQEDDDDG